MLIVVQVFGRQLTIDLDRLVDDDSDPEADIEFGFQPSPVVQQAGRGIVNPSI